MAKKEKVKKKRHTFRTVLIVIVVIIVLAIIGGAMGGSDDDSEETTTEAITETITEAVADEIVMEETESEMMTVDEALQEYMNRGYNLNRGDLIAHLEMDYPEDEVEEAVENSGIDWQELALENANEYLSGPLEYNEDDLREMLEGGEFTPDEIAYAIENADWSLQSETETEEVETETAKLTGAEKSLALIDNYECWGIEDGKAFWNVYIVEDAHFYDDDFIEAVRECVIQTDDPDVKNYAVNAYDSDNVLRFYWESDDNRYEITENDGDYYTDPSKLRTYTWELSANDVHYMLNERDSRY